MRDISRRDLVKGTAGTVAVSALAGCLGGDEEDSSGSGELALWWIDAQSEQHEPFNSFLVENIESETDMHLGLTGYSYSDLRENVLTGGRTGTPDVFDGVIEHPGDYVAADILEPLTDRTDEIPHFDGYLESALEAFRFQDELWALPYTGNGRALIYRKDVLSEYGYEDGPPSDLSEFMEVAATIHSDYDDMNGFQLTTERGEVRVTQEFLSHVYQLIDGSLFEWDGDGWELQASSNDFEAVLGDIYYEMFHGENQTVSIDYRGSGYETTDTGYTDGQHAMIHCGPWIQGTPDSEDQQTVMDEHTAVSLLPKHTDAVDATYMEVKPVMVNAHSENVDSAVQAASIFASPDAIRALAEGDPGAVATPVHEDLEATIEDEDFTGFTDAFENGVAPAPIAWGRVREPIYNAVEQVIYEEASPAEAADELETVLIEEDVELDPGE